MRFKLADAFPHNSWRAVLAQEFDKPYWARLEYHLNEDPGGFYPVKYNIFRAFDLTPLSQVRVVIIGQDPYQREGYAHGLAFSTLSEKVPPSLRNIFREAKIENPKTGNLTAWAKQGVLLLNTALTVGKNKAGSHLDLWEPFIGKVLTALDESNENVIFVAWGNKAVDQINNHVDYKRTVLTAAHPSRASANRGFFGCGHFTDINKLLTYRGEQPIDWSPRA